MKKQFLSLCLAVLMTVAALPFASAAKATVVDCGYYSFDDTRFFFFVFDASMTGITPDFSLTFIPDAGAEPYVIGADDVKASMECYGEGKAQTKLLTVTSEKSGAAFAEKTVIAAGSLRCKDGSTNAKITRSGPVERLFPLYLTRNDLPPYGEGNDPFISEDDDYRLKGRCPLPLRVALDGSPVAEIPGNTEIDLPVKASIGSHRMTGSFGGYTLLNESFVVLPNVLKYALEWFRLFNAGAFMLLPLSALSGVAALMNPLVGLALAPAWLEGVFGYMKMIAETLLGGKTLLK